MHGQSFSLAAAAITLCAESLLIGHQRLLRAELDPEPLLAFDAPFRQKPLDLLAGAVDALVCQ